jgi:lipopolysaccharide/colanic/teichoic acid biosynthesis glycosyltransferase
VSFAAITLCVASQRVVVVVVVVVVVIIIIIIISLSTQSGNFWIHPRITVNNDL